MNRVSWHLIRSFLAVAQLGSVSAAARSLGLSQPTLSRDIQLLEAQTALNLFKRSTRGLVLTEAGQALVEPAKQMSVNAEAFSRQASGLSTELAGDIRISANEVIGIYALPAAIAAFKQQHPAVQFEIVISNRASSLNKREADLALRMFRPIQTGLIARRLPDMPLAFYAHQDYLMAHGMPDSVDDLGQHQVIGFDQDTDFIDAVNITGYQFNQHDFHFRTDNMLMQIQLARHAAGIIVTHVGLAKHWPELVRILDKVPLPTLEFWIVCHADTQYNARISAFKKHLIEWFENDPYLTI